MSTLQRLLAKRPLRAGQVDIDGDTFAVRELTARERDTIGAMFASENKEVMRINATIACMGAEGLSVDDVDSLLDGPPETITLIAQRVLELSGMGNEAVDEAKPNS